MDRTQRVRERSESGATVGFGHLLREWRTRCHLSQLDLATGAGVSSRHLSFIETGRAQPSRELALLLAAVLDFPLREVRKGDLALSDFTTLTRLGTPHDITLQELRIESFFPADEATEEFSRA